MKGTGHSDHLEKATVDAPFADQLAPLLGRPTSGVAGTSGGVVVGELLGIKSDGRTPLVSYPNQLGVAAVPARSALDLRSIHIGSPVVLAFENADLARPIIVGTLRTEAEVPVELPSAHVEVEADGQRLIVSAREELVLRCGNASITLTKDGKVMLQGTYLSTQATGVNRIKGGSVQIN